MKRYSWISILVAILVITGGGMAFAGFMHANRSSGKGMGGSGSSNGDLYYHHSGLSCSPPATLPGKTVSVTVGDMGAKQMMGGVAPMGAHMMLLTTPSSVAAGQLSLAVSNIGWRTHELVILPLASGANAGQRVPAADGKVDETGSLAEASASCAEGRGQGINSGTAGWTTVTLPRGRYEVLCNLQNHYADGMWQELDVGM